MLSPVNREIQKNRAKAFSPCGSTNYEIMKVRELRIVFMGTPDFALQSLAALNVNFNVALVVTQPDKPIGRKKEIIFSILIAL